MTSAISRALVKGPYMMSVHVLRLHKRPYHTLLTGVDAVFNQAIHVPLMHRFLVVAFSPLFFTERLYTRFGFVTKLT